MKDRIAKHSDPSNQTSQMIASEDETKIAGVPVAIIPKGPQAAASGKLHQVAVEHTHR